MQPTRSSLGTLVLLSLAAGCAGDVGSPGGGSGGAPDVASGGAATASGGTSGAAAGGVSASGGSVTSGSGSASAAGGDAAAVGGAAATGGAAASGGDAGDGAGGSASGGQTGSGGAPGSGLAAAYPCDAGSDGYDVVMTGSASTWSVSGGGKGTASISTGMADALVEAYSRIAGSAGKKGTLLILGDGTVDANAQLKMPSYMVLNLCGTIEVTGTASSSDRSPLYARDRTDIDIPHARITGRPQYGMFFRNVPNVHLGEIILEFDKANSGLGIRYDNNPSAGGARVQNFTIDRISVKDIGGHGVETYGANGVVVGEFIGENTRDCGLILNDSINAEVGSVTCQDCADPGTGYAAFRVANSNGNDGGAFPAGNVHVGSVYARGGDRGIFSVSGSGGLTVDHYDIAGTASSPVLLQNCYNTTLGAVSGSVNGGELRISNDTKNTDNGTYAKTSNTIISNTTLSGGASLREDWCDATDRGNRAIDVTGGAVDMCHP